MMQTKKYLILVELLKKTDYNVKTSVIEGKIPSIQIITEKFVKLKKMILIIIMINTLLL